MADPLKPYEKAGRLVRLFAWLSIVASVGIIAEIILHIYRGDIQTGGRSIVGDIFLLIFFFLLTYFQFVLGTALKQHKQWGRKVGIGYAILQLFGFPIGTIGGAYILYCLIKGWDE